MRKSIIPPVFVPDGYKWCNKGEGCLHPEGPVLPVAEFYPHRSMADGRDNTCKLCRRDKLNEWRRITRPTSRIGERAKASIESEADVIREMRARGIYAMPGKSTEWGRLDIAAWGCVRIDAKAAPLSPKGIFQFGLGRKNKEYWELTDLMVLVCRYPDMNTYHVFPANHPVFMRNGIRKSGVSYQVGEHTPKHKTWVVLTDDLMEAHRDKWELVEEYRQRVIHLLENTDKQDVMNVTIKMKLD